MMLTIYHNVFKLKFPFIVFIVLNFDGDNRATKRNTFYFEGREQEVMVLFQLS